TDLHALDRVDTHHRVRDVRVELVEDRLAPADRHAGSHDGDARTAGIARLAQGIHEGFELRADRIVGGEKRIGADVFPGLERNGTLADLRQVTSNDDAMHLTQPLARDRAGSNAHRRFARRLPAAAAMIANAVFLPI